MSIWKKSNEELACTGENNTRLHPLSYSCTVVRTIALITNNEPAVIHGCVLFNIFQCVFLRLDLADAHVVAIGWLADDKRRVVNRA